MQAEIGDFAQADETLDQHRADVGDPNLPFIAGELGRLDGLPAAEALVGMGGAIIAAAPAVVFAFYKIFGLDANSSVGVGSF